MTFKMHQKFTFEVEEIPMIVLFPLLVLYFFPRQSCEGPCITSLIYFYQVNRVTIGDFDECSDSDHNDCSSQSDCINTEGSYTCKCREGFHDLSGSISLPGRVCSGEHLPSTQLITFGCLFLQVEKVLQENKCVNFSDQNGVRPLQPQRGVHHQRGWRRELRVQGLVRRTQLPDQLEAAPHRRLRVRRPHDLHRLRSLLLLLQGQERRRREEHDAM